MVEARYYYKSEAGMIELAFQSSPEIEKGKWVVVPDGPLSDGSPVVVRGSNLSASVLYWFGKRLWGDDWEKMAK